MSKLSHSVRPQDVLLIGGGVSALSVLCGFIRNDTATDRSILMMDDRPDHCGRVVPFAVHPDMSVTTLLSCLQGLPERIVGDARLRDVTEKVSRDGTAKPSVSAVATFLSALKRAVLNDLRRSGSLLLRAARCDTLRFESDVWSVDNQPGAAAHRLILATGADERRIDLLSLLTDHAVSVDAAAPVHLSDDWLSLSGAEQNNELTERRVSRLLVVGGDHSACASVETLLESEVGQTLGTAAILWMRPKGLTEDKRNRIEQICAQDDRLTYGDMDQVGTAVLQSIIADSDLTISALGSSAQFPRILVDGQVVKIKAPHIDASSRLLSADGSILPDVHAAGLDLTIAELSERPVRDNALIDWFHASGDMIARDGNEAGLRRTAA
jgi:hypothetical protein